MTDISSQNLPMYAKTGGGYQSYPEAGEAIPYGDIPALQADGWLPEYEMPEFPTVPRTSTDWGGGTGYRYEIGLFPEDHAAYIAGDTSLWPSILSTSDNPPDFGNISHAHKPNEYLLPYLMTGDPKYIGWMEDVWTNHQIYHQYPDSAGMGIKCNRRELAWSLRDLAILARLESYGLTTKTHYRSALWESWDYWQNEAVDAWGNPDNTPPATKYTWKWRVLQMDLYSSDPNYTTFGYNGWMEHFVGQVLGYCLDMGFGPNNTHSPKIDFTSTFTWHFEQLFQRVNEWAYKAIDHDHIIYWNYTRGKWMSTGGDWYWHMQQGGPQDQDDALDDATLRSNTTPYNEFRVANYNTYPSGELLPLDAADGDGQPYTFWDRAQFCYGWAWYGAKYGIPGAADLRDRLWNSINARPITGTVAGGTQNPGWAANNSYPAPDTDVWSGWAALAAGPVDTWVKVDTIGKGWDEIDTLLNDAGFPTNQGGGSSNGTPYVRGTFEAWTGCAFDKANGIAYYPWGGGHFDSSLNGIWKLDVEKMEWGIEKMPSDPNASGAEWSSTYRNTNNGSGWPSFSKYTPGRSYPNEDYLPDNRPCSSHSYASVWYDPVRKTVNRGRGNFWSYSITTKGTEVRNTPKDQNNISQDLSINGSLFYIEPMDRVVGSYYNGVTDANLYQRWMEHNPDDGGNFTRSSSWLPNLNLSAYCEYGGVVYGLGWDADNTREKFVTYDGNKSIDRWTSYGGTTGSPWTGSSQECQVCVYVPEWGKILRQFTQGSLKGQWYKFDPATEVNEPYSPDGEIPVFVEYPSNKVFYYPARKAVIYACGGDTYVMRTG